MIQTVIQAILLIAKIVQVATVMIVIAVIVVIAATVVIAAIVSVVTVQAATFNPNKKMSPKEKELENIQSPQTTSEEVNSSEPVTIKQIDDNFEYQEYYSENSPNFDVD